MKHLISIAAALFLVACAGPRYQPAPAGAEGQYFIASSPVHAAHRDLRYYGAFQAYGIYPWWEYTYYSPNFYPHYFAVWYPPWPYGYSGHYSRFDRGYPPYWVQRHGNWGRQAHRPAPVGPVPNPTMRVPDRPAGGHGRQSTIDLTGPDRPTLRRRHWPVQPIPAPSALPRMPVSSTAMPRPAVRPLERARARFVAPPSRPATQEASASTAPRTTPARERKLSRRDPSPYDQ